MIAAGSVLWTGLDPGGGSRGLNCRATNAANRTPNTATRMRARRCQRVIESRGIDERNRVVNTDGTASAFISLNTSHAGLYEQLTIVPTPPGATGLFDFAVF